MSRPASNGPTEPADAVLRVITFDADGGAPAALRRLAAVLEAEGCALHNVWLGAPIGGQEQLVFVTLRPLAAVPAVVAPTPPALTQAAQGEPCRHEWDTTTVHGDPPQLQCRLCGASSGTLADLTGRVLVG